VRVTPVSGKALVTEKARLEVSGQPRMVRAVESAAVVGGVGGTVSFNASYTRGDDLVYQWTVGGVRVPGAVRPLCFNSGTKVEVINGPTGSTLRMSNLAVPSKGAVTYPVRLEVRSKGGGLPSYQDARLTVRPK
jgi:outer membrane receptor for monomeric catechols